MPDKPRASGRSAGEEVAKEVSEENMVPVNPGPEERRRFKGPAFQRIRTDWEHEDAITVSRLRTAIDNRMLTDFPDAYRLLNAVYDIVREPKTDAEGNPVRDLHGMVVWATDAYGRYVEDWQRLNTRQREDLMYTITVNLFEWEQRAADAWSEAMYARARWEEDFAISFDDYAAEVGGRPTEADKTSRANRSAADARYYAVFLAGYSRKAEALVRSIERLSYRLERGLRQ